MPVVGGLTKGLVVPGTGFPLAASRLSESDLVHKHGSEAGSRPLPPPGRLTDL